MFCAYCYQRVDVTWVYCPACGIMIVNAEGISLEQIQDNIRARKDTLDVLKQIIVDLEKYGKMQTSSSLITNGAKIVSGFFWLAATGSSVAVAADLAAHGLGFTDLGISLLAKWKENGLLERADKICKRDVSSKNTSWFRIVLAGVEIFRSSPHTFNQRLKDGLKVCREGNPQNYAYKPKKTGAGLSMLANLKVFVEQYMKVYEGNYSSLAEQLKHHLKSLQEEYDKLISVSERELATIDNARQPV